MNRLLIFILTLIVSVSCNKTSKSETSNDQISKTEIDTIVSNRTDAIRADPEIFECPNFDFTSFQEQADSLITFLNRAQKSESKARIKWKRNFFCAFPDSFNEMQELFGFDDDKGAAPLYDYPTGNNIIGYFRNLTSIPKDKYYDKYISICINGVWEADNIREAFGFHERLLNDTEAACSSLATWTNKEIKSVFRFIFDGPHPKNDTNDRIYNQLRPKIKSQNERLASLLTESYNQLMAENEGHGH